MFYQNITKEYINHNKNDFLKERVVFLNGLITEELAKDIINQIFDITSKTKKEVIIIINSNGGDVYNGLAIYDLIKSINNDVVTICQGLSCSMAALILSSGTFGKRYSYPNSRIMIHQPLGSFKGQVSDIKIQTNEIVYLKKKLDFILSKNTFNSLEKIKKNTKRDYFMSPLKAINYKLIDHIIVNNV